MRPVLFTVHDIKTLSQSTGRKVPQCKHALEQSHGNIWKAEAYLRSLPSEPPLSAPPVRTPSSSLSPRHRSPRSSNSHSRSPRSGGLRGFFGGRAKTPPPQNGAPPCSPPPPPPPSLSPIIPRTQQQAAGRKSPRVQPARKVTQPVTGQYSGAFGAVPGMAGNTVVLYEEIKKARERKKTLELAAIRRGEAIADAAWKQKQKEEQRVQQLREFKHNEFLSKAGAARKKKEESLAATEKRMLARNQTASFVFLRDQKNAYENDQDKLADNKIQAEVASQVRAERVKVEREQRKEADRVAIEGFRYYRNRDRVAAKAAEDRNIQDYKLKSILAAGVKRDRDEAEKSLRSHMLRADADGKKETRANVNKVPGSQGARQMVSGDGAAVKAIREKEEISLRKLAVILAKDDLIDHLEVLVENGCMSVENLALLDEKDIAEITPKVVHRRKLLSLHKRVVQEMGRRPPKLKPVN